MADVGDWMELPVKHGTVILTVHSRAAEREGPVVILRSHLDERPDECVAVVWAHDRWVQITVAFPAERAASWRAWHIGAGGVSLPPGVGNWLGRPGG